MWVLFYSPKIVSHIFQLLSKIPVWKTVVQTHHVTVNRKKLLYTLISRRCCYRAGTRFFMRGVDQEGQVANYVETEQIIEYQGDKCSFIQVTIRLLFYGGFTKLYPISRLGDQFQSFGLSYPLWNTNRNPKQYRALIIWRDFPGILIFKFWTTGNKLS